MILVKVILFLLIILIAVVLLRTVMLKPTSAMDAKVQLDESERSVEYGKQLAKMIQKETISSRFEPDRTKFLEFHEVLEELFPNVHQV